MSIKPYVYDHLRPEKNPNINNEGKCESIETGRDAENSPIIENSYEVGYTSEKTDLIWVRTWDLYNKHSFTVGIACLLLLPLFPIVYGVFVGVMHSIAKSEFKRELARTRMTLINDANGGIQKVYDNLIKKQKHLSKENPQGFTIEKMKIAAKNLKTQVDVDRELAKDPLAQWRRFKDLAIGSKFERTIACEQTYGRQLANQYRGIAR